MSKPVKIIIDILLVIVCVVGAYFFSNWMFDTIPVSGPSMETTIHDQDNVILFKQGKYKRGDIVVFNTHIESSSGEVYYIKRIIGLPGDTVEIKKDGAGYFIFVNGEKQEENYLGSMLRARESDAHGPIVVPEGKFYFCGDNRQNSSDSRASFLGEMDAILGRVILKYDADDGFLDELEIVKRANA
ncbi:MAG: signal peptidase I [Clostridia bacterium]|nr:signal peptidase I [Clostridia bacterium]